MKQVKMSETTNGWTVNQDHDDFCAAIGGRLRTLSRKYNEIQHIASLWLYENICHLKCTQHLTPPIESPTHLML